MNLGVVQKDCLPKTAWPLTSISRYEASQIAEKAAKKGNSIEWKLEQEKENQAV